MRRIMLAVVLALCAACGGGSDGGRSPASVNGAIGGQSMTARDAISNVLQVGGGNSAAGILITNVANTCAMLSANRQPRNVQAIIILMGNQSAGGVTAPTSTGPYTVYPLSGPPPATGNVAFVAYGASDASCKGVASYDGASGNVTLTRVDSSGYAGTFDVTFSGAGGRITGSFTSSTCPGLSANANATCT